MRSGLPWLSVLTCPTRPQYLEQTIAAIDAAGGRDFLGTKVICVDGNPTPEIRSRLAGTGWAYGPAHADHQTKGSARAMLSILQAAYVDDAPFVLYFEDDVILARWAVKAMYGLPVPANCWALQFCDLKRRGRRSPSGYNLAISVLQEDHHWGNQALKIPRSTLTRVAGVSSLEAFQQTGHPRGHASDVLLGKIGSSPEMPFLGVVAPSLVQHIGAESICNPNRDLSEYGRSAHNFAGVDFDARTLLGGE